MAVQDVQHGKLARIYRKTGASTYVLVANANEWTANILRETAEGRVFENDAVQRRAGLQDSNITLGGLMEATLGDGYLLGLMVPQQIGTAPLTVVGGTAFIRFFINNVGTVPVLQGSMILTDLAIAASVDGLPTFSATAAAAGALHIVRATAA